MILQPAVAGKFYPGNPDVLRKEVLNMLKEASDKTNLSVPKAIIAPHAGYIYSGPIAASAYACLHNAQDKIKRIVLFAPAHRYPVKGVATTAAEFYLTPLGQIAIDHKIIADTPSPSLSVVEQAFITEHAVEVHLPFLQLILKNFLLVPFVVGSVKIRDVEKIMENFWDEDETLIVISSDLSHYLPYDVAQQWDKETADAIINLNPEGLADDHACGATAIKALLGVAKRKKLKATQIDLRNSGDTAGFKDSVVGYGAFHFK